jgi:hypothetical protein
MIIRMIPAITPKNTAAFIDVPPIVIEFLLFDAIGISTLNFTVSAFLNESSLFTLPPFFTSPGMSAENTFSRLSLAVFCKISAVSVVFMMQ